jgi:hypothetical protein
MKSKNRIFIEEAKLLSETDTIEDSEITPDDTIVVEFRKKNGT